MIEERCPFIDECNEKLTEDEYQSLCIMDCWIHCKKIPKDIRKKYEKLPRDWQNKEIAEEL